MGKNLDRYTIWKIGNEESNLKSILDLLGNDYNQSIKYLENSDVRDYEKTLNNKWINPDGSSELSIKEYEFKINSEKSNSKKVEYIYAKGLFETNLSEERAIVNGNILPRESRIFNHSCEACFIAINDAVYVVLKINSTDESRVRNKLMKYHSDTSSKNLWGTIKYHKVPDYLIDSEFFYWLLHKKDKVDEIQLENEKMRVLDISQVFQEDKYEIYTTHSMGEDILGSTSALSAFGESQKINKTGVIFVNEQIQIAGLVDTNSVFFIDIDQSNINSNKNDFVSIAIYIYTYLLPQLFEAWSSEKNKVYGMTRY
ncbi:hypothetical protein AAA450_09235 [Staphylococcus equorum]|uniref:hypothetical protein n=1 Tax=Staphylococcus equorum TaxID=246432 RepID=UPI003D801AD8